MTTITDPRLDAASLLGGCRYNWCLAALDCINPTGYPEDLVIHEGRCSENNDLMITPYQFDHVDGTPYSGPRVQFNGCPNGRIVAELTLDDAREAAATLARFAAGEAPVGTAIRFVEGPNVDGERFASITITRDPDETWSYNRRNTDVRTYTSVRITVDNPIDDEDAQDFEFHGPAAATMAREIIAITREMAA